MALPPKQVLRAELLAARRRVAPGVRDVEGSVLRAHALAAVSRADTVAAYVPVGSEPGSRSLLDALLDGGVTVLLPVARTGADGAPQPLQWAPYTGRTSLRRAAWGLWEPAGDPMPPEAIGMATTVLVPALAVDRAGVRLGRGAGYYDRSLRFRDPAARLIAVVRDDELLAALPSAPHDVPMTHALTPSRGLVTLAASGNTD
ncbi:5-formyltetrahydrofolate cyclo-ligase [Mycobacterium sp. MYCO198283]|uniref:5-formyltetrahydrofolate cyclo-ligase n=1 Tax=Mycobacterium sp. MYCO198283 TaxID=2883505 RepID=UPI001E418723|nr:5-formyltetrahydrofolate cyclo-ligase [Mycobacterium sp. MYCO198283]MCG5430976.1 5-formyltetrahydrofolate cyclo-ligase [Mycobacterium sp. MYCO198283]